MSCRRRSHAHRVAIAIVVALNRNNLARADLLILFAVVLQNLLGLAAGYWI